MCFLSIQNDNIKCVAKQTSPLICEPPCIMGVCMANGTSDLGYCKCDPFFTGDTCDYYACHTFCYNNGICYLEPGDPDQESVAMVLIVFAIITFCII